MIIKINGKEFDTYDEMRYCSEYNEWNECDNEMHCCQIELENQLIAQEYWRETWELLSLKNPI